jgi:hypothetical protein
LGHVGGGIAEGVVEDTLARNQVNGELHVHRGLERVVVQFTVTLDGVTSKNSISLRAE